MSAVKDAWPERPWTPQTVTVKLGRRWGKRQALYERALERAYQCGYLDGLAAAKRAAEALANRPELPDLPDWARQFAEGRNE